MRRGIKIDKGEREEWGRARVANLGFANNKEIKGPRGIKEQASSPLTHYISSSPGEPMPGWLNHSIFSLHGEFMSCCSILHRDLILVKTIILNH